MNATLIIEGLKNLGYEINRAGDDIVLKAKVEPDPKMAKKLTEELRAYKSEAIEVLKGWQGADKKLIDQFLLLPVPEAPFYLNPWTRVQEPGKFYAAIRRDIDRGVAGPRAKTGALVEDIERLIKLSSCKDKGA